MARHNLNLYKFLKIPAITILLQLTQVEVTSLPCELTWVEDSRGSIPDWALESGPGEYVARIFVTEESKWIGGKLRPSTQKMVLVDVDDNEKFYDSYFILTNPHNCIINWEPWRQNVPPEGSVLVAQGQSNDFIGRGKTDDNYVVGGTLDGQNGRLRVSHKGHQVVIEKPGKIWILTSLYPLLQGSVTDFNFDQSDLDLAYDTARVELVGAHVMQNFVQTAKENEELILMEKTLIEKFIFEETTHNWQGIGDLTLDFSLWFTSDVSTTTRFQNVSTARDQRLAVSREKTVTFSESMLYKDLIASGSVKQGQFCAYILIPNPSATIGFAAKAAFWAPKMSVEQVKFILEKTGRVIVGGGEVDLYKNIVFTEVKGTLSGRFGLHTYSSWFNVNAATPMGYCVKLHGGPAP